MKLKTFKGGVHPHDEKEKAKEKPLKRVQDPPLIFLHVNQHLGAPNTPLVKAGDLVKKGQKLAETESLVSAPVHSPVSGKVKKVENFIHPNQKDSLAIIIENDGLSSFDSGLSNIENPYLESKEILRKRIKDAGIVGMGGATFPTHVKLTPPLNKPIDIVIANGAECEPYLSIDYRYMLERSEEIIKGLKITMYILGAKKGYIGVEDNKKEVLNVLNESILKDKDSFDIEVTLLKTKYPEGAEKMLIQAITGREVPSGGLPLDVGVVVQNTGTLYAIYDAVYNGMPLIERGFTVNGSCVFEPLNLIAPLGTQLSYLLEKEFTLKESIEKIIIGGPMMGVAQITTSVPIIKGTSGILLFTKKEVEIFKEGPCIRCGRCHEACAAHLMPMMINNLIKKGFIEQAKKIGLLDCFECGACSYACPSKIPLVQNFRVGKQLVLESKK